uniref:Uncharacterized protein n=1 Tax=Macrostomum lignano TaxID=282301 RepID=A0A1I8HK00_9PLAT
MQSSHSAARGRPATTAIATLSAARPPPELTVGSEAARHSLLLPAYTAHRARCQRDYAAMCSRFPTLSVVSAVSASDGPRRRYLPAAATASHHGNADGDRADGEGDDDAFWPTGFVTSLRRP